MRTATVLASLAVILTALSVAPGAEADDSPYDCKDSGDDRSCDFSCRQGDTVTVRVTGDGYVSGSAECHSASAACQDEHICEDRSEETATSSSEPGDQDGDCDGDMDDGTIFCMATGSSDGGDGAVVELFGVEPVSCGTLPLLDARGLSSFTVLRFESGQLVHTLNWKAGTWLSPPTCSESA